MDDLRTEVERMCAVASCQKPPYARGWCTKHYQRWRKHGDPRRTKTSLGSDPEDFWIRVDTKGANGCWLWTGSLSPEGYGKVQWQGHYVGVHRLALELLRGPIPDDHHVDHLCKVRHCVNPDHLEPVTPAENNARSDSPTARNARKSTCVRGHLLAGENVYLTPKGRHCRKCKIQRQRAYRARSRS